MVLAVVLGCVVAFAFAVPAAEARPNVDLLTDFDVRIDGADDGDISGYSVSAAGDVNGDGIDDIIIGAPNADNNSDYFLTGSAYVVYGSAGASSFDLADLGPSTGFRIDGGGFAEEAGHSVSAAGDVNADGFDDVIVGVYRAAKNDRAGSGAAYVVFGSAQPANIDLTSLDPDDGFQIDGAAAIEHAGRSVAGGTDINGDGIDDVIVSATSASKKRPRIFRFRICGFRFAPADQYRPCLT